MSPANWHGEFLLPLEGWSSDRNCIWNTDRDLMSAKRDGWEMRHAKENSISNTMSQNAALGARVGDMSATPAQGV